MKKALFGLFVLSLLLSGAAPLRAASLTLTIRDGKVSLNAQDVTVRQILTEWAKVGKTRIINLERVTSGPVTLRFEGVSEQAALDIILRNIPGYMAAPRATFAADASVYDRILIMATTTAVAARPTPSAQTQSPAANMTQLRMAAPVPMSPGLLPEPNDDPNESDDPAIAAAAAAGLIAVPAPATGATGFNPSGLPIRAPSSPTPAPPQAAPTATTSPSNPWNAPVGASRPGLATPPPPSTTPPLNRPVGGPRAPQPADR